MSSQTVSEGVACIKTEYIWVKPEVVESDKRSVDDVGSDIGPEAKKLKSDTNGEGQAKASANGNGEKNNGNESKRSQRKRGLTCA